MPTAETERNKATSRHFSDAMNTNDAEIISKTIDELVEPDALIRTPLPIAVTGPRAMKEVFARLHRAYPDLHITVEDLMAEGDRERGHCSKCFGPEHGRGDMGCRHRDELSGCISVLSGCGAQHGCAPDPRSDRHHLIHRP